MLHLNKLRQLARFFVLSWLCLHFSVSSADSAQELFADLKQAIYQVRVIDIGSGDKYTIGSGFQVTASGQVATNYHVVSSYIHKPEKFRIELVDSDEQIIEAQLLNFDVIHDLALLQIADQRPLVMALYPKQDKQGSLLDKGDRIFSIGNPHDLGMTIIEGTYNGLLKNSRYQKILFSGSLNSGMSGGPAINTDGKVIGINVSKQGEEISFLVPVKFLHTLMANTEAMIEHGTIQSESAEAEHDQYIEWIGESLLQDQDEYYQPILAKEFELEPLGELRVPADLSESLKCWGRTVDKKDNDKLKHRATNKTCQTSDSIYVQDRFYVGNLSYRFEWLTTDELNSIQFYRFIQNRFSHGSPRTGYDGEDLTSYQCKTQFIKTAGHGWKASTCFRAYKDYPGMYDMTMVMTSVDESNKAAVMNLNAGGISKNNALQLLKKMINAVEWAEPAEGANAQGGEE